MRHRLNGLVEESIIVAMLRRALGSHASAAPREATIAALAYDVTDQVETPSHWNTLLRILDALAAWQMRQSLRVISRAGTVKAANDDAPRLDS